MLTWKIGPWRLTWSHNLPIFLGFIRGKWPPMGFTASKFLYHFWAWIFRILSRNSGKFSLDFGSIYSQFLWISLRIWLKNSWFSLNLTIKWAIFSLNFGQRFGFNFIDFHSILLSNFIQNCFRIWEKYLVQFLGFYYQIFIDLTLLQHFYFCITFVNFKADFISILSGFGSKIADFELFWD